MPSATCTGADQWRPSVRAVQITTSGWRSCGPPNHAARKPPRVSTIVEAWLLWNGAVSKMNSDFTRPAWRAGATEDDGCRGGLVELHAATNAININEMTVLKFIRRLSP